jgi:hypothetical protein
VILLNLSGSALAGVNELGRITNQLKVTFGSPCFLHLGAQIDSVGIEIDEFYISMSVCAIGELFWPFTKLTLTNVELESPFAVALGTDARANHSCSAALFTGRHCSKSYAAISELVHQL